MAPDDTLAPDGGAELFADAMQRAASRQLDVSSLIGSASALQAQGNARKAAELYKNWIAFNYDNALLHAVYFNYAVVLSEAGDLSGTVVALKEVIRLKPDFYPPYINLGVTFEKLGRPDWAVAEWTALVNRLPSVTGDAIVHKTSALKQIGRVLGAMQRDRDSEDVLKQCLDIDPGEPEIAQHLVALRQRQCKWPVAAASGRADKRKLLASIAPLSLACLADDPMFQLTIAASYGHGVAPVPAKPEPGRADRLSRRPASPKLRIGYVSSDLRAHAVGFAMTDVIEQHDRKDFEIFAYYCGVPASDRTQERIKASVDHWLDINPLDDRQASRRIEEDGIDILVDLNGYTKDARTKVFAERPAPIQVNWFGFPGTMGSPYHHYLIADDYVVPPGSEIYYSEKIVRLPCYQPNDRRRVVAPDRPSRAEVGLPETGMVYCCLNGVQKLTLLTFQRWMLILQRVPDSVIWILDASDETNARVRHYAAEYGVSPDRIVFAGRMGNPEHLARYALADLFLDTFPYGAHTSASDSLWMGVPLLTLPGRSFASRVCGSVLRAAGLDELICASPADYVGRAIELGQNPEKLADVKRRLAANRDSCVLFDTPLLVRSLEDLYREMWSDFARGKLPVPDFRNLDLYREIALDTDPETTELLDDAAYLARYRDPIAERHGLFPVAPDCRMWLSDRDAS